MSPERSAVHGTRRDTDVDVVVRLCQFVPFVAALGLAGCANFGSDVPIDSGARMEEDGAVAGTDAGATDAAGLDGGGGLVDVGASPGLFEPEADCFDFADDDSDTVIDCADPGCFVAPVCCALGSSSTSCCTPGVAADLAVDGCDVGGDARDCAEVAGAAVVRFGGAPLVVAAGAVTSCGTSARILVPGTSEMADTGLRLPGTIDIAASRTEIRFTLGRSERAGLARAGIAIVADQSPGARVLPLLGVVISRGELRVVVGEAEVFHTADVGACAEHVPMRVVVEAGGAYSVFRDGSFLHGGALDLAELGAAMPRASVLVYGRHDDGPPAAWASDVSVRSDVCSRLAPARSTAPAIEGVSRDAMIGRVSVARVTPTELGRAVIEVDGRILPATEVATGIRVDDAVNPLVTAVSASTGPDWARGASDPQLVVRDDGGGYLLLFTGHDDDGTTAFFTSVLSSTLGSPTVPEPTFTLAQATTMVGTSVTAIAHPTYFERDGAGYLLFVATTATGTALRLASLASPLDLDADLTPIASGQDAAYADDAFDESYDGALVSSGVGSGFDRDEIGAARVVDLGDSVVRILYAGRRGTRWAVGALVSSDLTHFDHVDGGAALLAPSGIGFDRLGVLSPEPVVGAIVDGVADLTIYYTGSAGTETSLGAATQSIHVGAP